MKVLCFEQECSFVWNFKFKKFTAKNVLKEAVSDRADKDDWSIMEDKVVAGIHIVVIGEDVEGDTLKFFYPKGKK